MYFVSLLIRKIKNVFWFRHVKAITLFVEKNIRASFRKITVGSKLPVSKLILFFSGHSKAFDAAAFVLTHGGVIFRIHNAFRENKTISIIIENSKIWR